MKNIITSILFLLLPVIFLSLQLEAQVAVNDDGSSANSSAMLDVKSTSKGLLIPRVALTSTTSNAPIGSGVTTSMMVYNTATTSDVVPGFYFWNGSYWERVQSNGIMPIKEVTSNITLKKSDVFVLAEGEITLTLPTITTADNGVTITIKADGTYMDHVIVQGSGGATIDDHPDDIVNYEMGRTYVAEGGNWISQHREDHKRNTFIVEPRGSWRNLAQIIAYLNKHMDGPSIIQLGGDLFGISDSTLVIDLPYPLTIQGSSYGETTIGPESNMSGKALFSCNSECYFKMLILDGSTLSGYGASTNEDGIHFTGSQTYHEIKDSYFVNLNKGIVLDNNVDIWLFDVDFELIAQIAFEINSTGDSTKVRINAADFINCRTGVDMVKGKATYFSMTGCGFDLKNISDNGIIYRPSANFTYDAMYITGNTWNNIGTFYSGFDFTRTDGRDAMIYVERNAGASDENPHYKENVINNNSTTTLTNANAWYKADWTTTSKIVTSWDVSNNKSKYLSKNKRDVTVYISGDLSVNNNSRTISIALVKNGASATRYGETTLRITTANQPFQFSTVILLENIGINDFLELYCSSTSAGDIVKFQDVQIYAETK